MSSSIACIDYRNGKFFIAKRQMTGDMGGRWEFPGGKIEEGEDFEIAIKREMKEEFGVDVKVGRQITCGQFEHRGVKCFLYVFEVTFAHDGLKQRFVLSEHTDYKWVLPQEIEKLDFVDSDMAVYPEIKKWCLK